MSDVTGAAHDARAFDSADDTCRPGGARSRVSGAAPRFAVANLGCRVNRVELDAIAAELEASGCELVDETAADLVVVNTCAVTGEAEAKARKAVRHAAQLPHGPLVVATGCVASLFTGELEALAPNVVVEPEKERVATRALGLLGVEPRVLAGAGVVRAGCGSGGTVTPTGRMRPGLKVQDGCDHRCTYCIVWKARGAARSLDADEVVSRVRALVDEGAREVVLTGIDLGRYESAGLDLSGLLARILDETEVGRVRLSSVEPAGVTPELLALMAESDGRVAPFLHVPLQSGCDATLARMGRPYTSAEYLHVATEARRIVRGLALACDLIVGFPGETEAEFAASLETCRRVGFANMHVFRYSRRPGTSAATMDGQVAPDVMAERSLAMRELAAASRRSYVESLVGTEQLVLVERRGFGVTGGLVRALVDEGASAGSLVRVRPVSVTPAGMLDAR